MAAIPNTSRTVVFGRHDQKVLDQLDNCVAQEDGALGVLCADGHFGYSAPIGGVVAYRDHVSPAAVGYDIGCGNLAVATNLMKADVANDLPVLMDRVFAEVSFGMGRGDGRAFDHPILERVARAEFTPQRELWSLARKQLGTVGAGNHYVDLFEDEGTGRVWVGVHFGSRGFGHKTASGFLALAKGLSFGDHAPEGEMSAPPDVLDLAGGLGQSYLHAMELAGAYAHAGREVVVAQVLGILGATAHGEPIHNHHNYAWIEEHGGERWVVTRKGATPAFPGQRGFVGASMGESAVILEGVEGEASAAALYSTVHGAGRAMSRTAAAGRQRKRWSCNNRGCDYRQLPREPAPTGRSGSDVHDRTCPKCGERKLVKRWVTEQAGAIDWAATTADLRRRGIELRGANAEEAPGAYKRLDAVLAEHAGTVRVLHRLKPLGVAMAPGGTRDAYKD
jgi:tRNA-splicing ligase RtcB